MKTLKTESVQFVGSNYIIYINWNVQKFSQHCERHEIDIYSGGQKTTQTGLES